ncbi:hypothetical protein HK099_003738, partial [Clydaea vesicula]
MKFNTQIVFAALASVALTQEPGLPGLPGAVSPIPVLETAPQDCPPEVFTELVAANTPFVEPTAPINDTDPQALFQSIKLPPSIQKLSFAAVGETPILLVEFTNGTSCSTSQDAFLAQVAAFEAANGSVNTTAATNNVTTTLPILPTSSIQTTFAAPTATEVKATSGALRNFGSLSLLALSSLTYFF